MLPWAAILLLNNFFNLQMNCFFSAGHNLHFSEDFQFSYNFGGKNQLIKDGESISLQYYEVTVPNHDVLQFGLFQIPLLAISKGLISN